jgi:hypothetical protein
VVHDQDQHMLIRPQLQQHRPKKWCDSKIKRPGPLLKYDRLGLLLTLDCGNLAKVNFYHVQFKTRLNVLHWLTRFSPEPCP